MHTYVVYAYVFFVMYVCMYDTLGRFNFPNPSGTQRCKILVECAKRYRNEAKERDRRRSKNSTCGSRVQGLDGQAKALLGLDF